MQHLHYDQKTIQQKLKLMTHYDVDQQFMAATDLSQIIQKFHQKISQDNLSRIINALLEHLKNQSTELHGNAIKCLSKVISKLPLEESKRVCTIMINNIISQKTNTEVRDIYGTCVKTIINDVGVSFGQHIKDLLKLAILALLDQKQVKNTTVHQELVDIITPFMKKWPKQVQQLQLPRQQFLQYLLKNILIGKEPILRKRSYICLGIFSTNLTVDEFQLVLLDLEYGLLKHFALTSDLQKKKIMIHSILAILRSGNHNLESLSKKIIIQLLKSIKQLKEIDDISRCQKIFQLLESSIQCLTNLVKISPKLFQLSSSHSDQIYKLCQELVEYSPYGTIQKATDMEIQQDEYEQQDTSDFSWKVRKNTIQLIVEIGSVNQQMFKKYIKINQLFDRFSQNEPQIVETVINGFNSLFSSFTKQSIQNHQNIIEQVQEIKLSKRESLVSVVANLLDKLIIHLDRVMNDNNLHQSIKVSAARLISLIGRLFTSQITDSQQLTNTYVDVAHKVLSKTRYNQVKIQLLHFFQSILKNIKIKIDFNKLVQLFQKSTHSNIYKVSSSTFKAIQALLSIEQIGWSNQLGNAILERSKETDIDQEIKNSIIGCISEILQRSPNIPIHYLEEYLTQLLSKLNTEIEKRHTISAIWKINTGITLNEKIIQILNHMTLAIANIGLNITDNVIRIKSSQAIRTLLIILSVNVKRDVVDRILDSSRQIFKDKTYPLFLGEIIKTHPQSVVDYLSDIISLNDLPVESVKHLVESNVININKLLGIIEGKLNGENIKNVIKVISNMDIDVKQLENIKDNKFKDQLIIGYLGSKKDVNNFELFLKIVLDQNKNQNIRCESSCALGVLSSINIQQYLPILLVQVNKNKDNYHLINSIKHLILNSSPSDQKSLLDLQQLFFKVSNINQSTIILVAECIGLITNKHLTASYNIIIDKLTSNDHNIRFLASSSYRYFTNTTHSETDILVKYIEGLLGLLNDENVPVRSAVVKSLNIIAFYSSHLLSGFLNDKFFGVFNKLLEFREDLVEIVNYGSSKEKIDRGKIIRIEGFTFLETLLDKVNLSQRQISWIISGCLATVDIDTASDVVINRIQLLKRIININVKLFKERQVQTLTRLGVSEGKLKEYRQKQQITDSKIEKIISSILYLVGKLEKNTVQNEVKVQFQKIKQIPLFKQKLKHIRT